ncbi:MAG TPA: hypothetical protein PKE55_04235 [Kiritimatiellia bacterium]|nr:hypothetical protein [Kiritimatiellia bacterium]
MKTTWIAGCLAVGLTLGAGAPAQAMNREWAAVAGFVGGVLVSHAVHAPRATVVHHHAPVVRETVVIHEPPPSGYWEVRSERIWVPGQWIHHDLGCGRFQRVWQPGHYQVVQRRVWVETSFCSSRRVVRHGW